MAHPLSHWGATPTNTFRLFNAVVLLNKCPSRADAEDIADEQDFVDAAVSLVKHKPVSQ